MRLILAGINQRSSSVEVRERLNIPDNQLQNALIEGLEQCLESIRKRQIERYSGRLAKLTPEQYESIDALTRGIVNKIFNASVTAIKSSMGGREHNTLVNLVETIGANY